MVLKLRACSLLPQYTIVFSLSSLFCFAIAMDQAALSGNHFGILLWSNWRGNHLQKRNSRGHLVPASHWGDGPVRSVFSHFLKFSDAFQKPSVSLLLYTIRVGFFFPPDQTYILLSASKPNTYCQLWKTTGHGNLVFVTFFTVIFYLLEIYLGVPNLCPLFLRLNKGKSFNLLHRADVFKSFIFLMLPFSFWHATVCLHFSMGLKVGKRPKTRTEQNLIEWLLFIFFFLLKQSSNIVNTVQLPTQGHLVSFDMPYRSPQLTDAAPQVNSSPMSVHSPVPHRCLSYQSSRKDTIFKQFRLCVSAYRAGQKKNILQSTN